MKFIVKLSPEITIKTKPVRRNFTNRLLQNIRKVLRYKALTADVVMRWDMLEVVMDSTYQESNEAYNQRVLKLAEVLQCIPGIAHFIRVEDFYWAEDKDKAAALDKEEAMQNIAAIVVPGFLSQVKNKTFMVRCKRSGKHSFSSMDIERYLGKCILEKANNTSVSISNPDIVVSLEIKSNRLFIVNEKYTGMGGYPIGCVGQVLTLISGGFDSCVASYDTIRRGMQTHFCFFNLGGHAHEVGVKQVAHYLWDKYSSSHKTAFISIPFEEIVAEILEKISNPYMGVVLKRMMIRAASQISDEMVLEGLVTGECISQVSSQTLHNLAVIDQVSTNLMIRPLLCVDKNEIIKRSQQIGISKLAESIPEYCAVISDKPTTAAKLDVIEMEERNFDFSVLENAIANRKMEGINRLSEKNNIMDQVKSQKIPEHQQVIIDLRTVDEIEQKPLVLHANEVICIPSYKVNQVFAELDMSKQYLLYCDKGAMSRLHVAHLQSQGHNNVSVYLPE